jgi:hypothetical protein
MTKKSSKILFILVAISFFSACGIEDVPFLYPIPDSNIIRGLANTATVRIPSENDDSFSHFEIFYRIYVSDIDSDTPLNILNAINPTLASDWGAISPHIDSETFTNINMGDLFRGRRYYQLLLRDEIINAVLSSSVFDTSLIFNFPLFGGTPTMTIAGTPYTLWRSDGLGAFEPRPDRYFRNRQELSETIDSTINADVAPRANLAPGSRVFTYAAMFIMAVGRDGHTAHYSTPSLINIFRLPDW